MNRTWKKIAIYPLIPLVATATMGACSSDSDSDSAPTTSVATAATDDPGTTTDPGTTDPGATDTTGGDDPATTTTTTSGEGEGDCFVHLFDSDDFDTSDDNFKLTEQGRYATLDDLPGAEQDWSDEADGIEVGQGATVTIWEEENFEGAPQELDAGSQNSDIEEPSSMELICN